MPSRPTSRTLARTLDRDRPRGVEEAANLGFSESENIGESLDAFVSSDNHFTIDEAISLFERGQALLISRKETISFVLLTKCEIIFISFFFLFEQW